MTSHNIRILFVLLIALLNILLTFLQFQFHIYNEGFSFCDFMGQWMLTAYTLQGIDPYPLIGLENALIDSIGTIPKGWGTSPWGLLLGNFFYPGFLSLELAKKYFVVLNLILICITALCFSKKLKQLSKRLSWYAFICTLFSFWSFYSICDGNAGCGICCLLMLVVLLHDSYPVFSGILLGIAMTKPQISLIFCITLLFMKRYRVVFISFAVVFVSLLIVSGIVHNNPVSLVYEFLNAGIGNNENYAGIFTLLFLDNRILAMALSMLTGIVLVGVIIQYLSKELYNLFYFFPACLVSTFWSYSFYNEFYILLFPLIVCIYLILYVQKILMAVAVFLSALYLSIGSFILFYLLYYYLELFKFFSISGIVVHNSWINIWWSARTAFEIGILILTFF